MNRAFAEPFSKKRDNSWDSWLLTRSSTGAIMTSYSEILYEKQRGGVLVTLNRPETRNALSPPLLKELHRALDAAYQKTKATSRMKKWPFQIWLHRVDEFRNCFLYENIFETNPHIQAVELAIAQKM